MRDDPRSAGERPPRGGESASYEQAMRAREGAAFDVVQTRYERDPVARKKCIAHHGHVCAVCKMRFVETYGELGKDFIHVHHLNPLADAGGEHEVDPISDLIPVCPNCHAMLHRRTPPFSIEELRKKLKSTR